MNATCGIKMLTNNTELHYVSKICDKKHAHTAWHTAQRHLQHSSAAPQGSYTLLQTRSSVSGEKGHGHSPTPDQCSNGKLRPRPKGAGTCRHESPRAECWRRDITRADRHGTLRVQGFLDDSFVVCVIFADLPQSIRIRATMGA